MAIGRSTSGVRQGGRLDRHHPLRSGGREGEPGREPRRVLLVPLRHQRRHRQPRLQTAALPRRRRPTRQQSRGQAGLERILRFDGHVASHQRDSLPSVSDGSALVNATTGLSFRMANYWMIQRRRSGSGCHTASASPRRAVRCAVDATQVRHTPPSASLREGVWHPTFQGGQSTSGSSVLKCPASGAMACRLWSG